ncbi:MULTISPECIES: LuxR C-terminal-related transcriptional regulator [unclassified Sphingomonas]|uniref:LuxR C-terminal-related transcriptional regulator n=1 Tax=unclassified Sphingomonas TaxID=196159 RepID=UPI00028A27BA|nr:MULTISPECIES: response regulator transcription factor [unclassified Sphingomonas]
MTAGHILIADDHPLTREGLILAVKLAVPGVAVDTAGSIAEAEQAAALRKKGHKLVLLDFVLPDSRGFSGFLQLQHLLGQTPIAFVSANRDPGIIETAQVLGAVGFLSKSWPLDQLTVALREIVAGKRVFPVAGTTPRSTQSARDLLATLSGAQRRVMLALADGRLNKQIAGDLGITEATVKAHMSAIFRKLGVTNRAQALLAMQPLLGEADRIANP